MSGQLGDLSEKQQERLDRLKESVKDILTPRHDDALLLRFLRARNFDLKKTEDMFRKDCVWRQEWKVDTVLTEWKRPEVIEKYWGGGLLGCDKIGRPVWLDMYGRRDIKGIMHSVKGTDIMMNYIWWNAQYEQIMKENAKLLNGGNPIDGMIVVSDQTDMEKQGFWKPSMDLGKQIMSLFEQHYPEFLRMFIVINAPSVFNALWAIVKPLMREETRKKTIILGTDYKEELLKWVPAEILPAKYGGTLTDPDGDAACPSKVNYGGVVPTTYYMKDRVVSSQAKLISRVLGAGVSIEFEYAVSRPHSVLYYEFKTKDKDLAFSIKNFDKNGNKKNVLEKRRYNCQLVPEDGKVILSEPGTYVIKFDNSFSLFSSKSLSYWVEVLEPLGDDEEVAFQETAHDFTVFD